MKNLTMKSLFTLALAFTLSTGFLTACDNKSSKNPNGGVYDPYHPNNNGQFYAKYRYVGNLQVKDKSTFREFLQGDACYSKRRDCKRIDGNPFVQFSFGDLKFANNQSTRALVTYQFRDRAYPQYNGGASASYLLAFQKLNNGRLLGSAYDANPRNGIGARVEYVIHGDPSYGFRVQVLYDGYLMLEGRLTLSR